MTWQSMIERRRRFVAFMLGLIAMAGCAAGLFFGVANLLATPGPPILLMITRLIAFPLFCGAGAAMFALVYFAPLIIWYRQGGTPLSFLATLNLILGWTGIGWLMCLGIVLIMDRPMDPEEAIRQYEARSAAEALIELERTW